MCHSPGAESHKPGCRTASRRKTPVGHRLAGLWHRGRRRVRRERSRDGRQSRDRAPCGSDRGVHRWQQLAPCEHPPDSIAGREVTRNMLDYTAHMSSMQAKYFNRDEEERKKAVPRCDAASRWGELRGCAPTDIGQKCRLNYLSILGIERCGKINASNSGSESW